MMTDHQSEKVYKCDKCNKTFHLEWRLKRHKRIHDFSVSRNCHYYNNEMHCPFEEIGCKFYHKQSVECYYGVKCHIKLCQYRHLTNLKEDASSDNIVSEDYTATNDIQVQKDEEKDENREVHKGKEKIDIKSAAETEDVIECAHFDMKMESCVEYTDINESENCEDWNKLLCSSCVQYTELYQQKQFKVHTKRRCLPCIKKKVVDISRHSNSGSGRTRTCSSLRGNK